MAYIELREIDKDYRILAKKKGALAFVLSLIKPEYKVKKAVNNISFSIEKGESVGFIGPNGAGKSTTVKMLTGILVPTRGEITVGGLSPHRDRKRYTKKIGVVFGQRTQLWWDLPIEDTFDLLKDIYQISDAAYRNNLEIFHDLLGLRDFMAQPVRQLSLGQRMRADIAAALLHNPEVIFLDEPTIGLDIVAKERIRNFIKHVNREYRTTILFTTHDMSDIEKVCQRIIIIDKGVIVYDGSIVEIKRVFGKQRVLFVEFNQKCGGITLPDIIVEPVSEYKVKMVFEKDRIKVADLISHLTSNYDVSDLTINEPEIEAIIRKIYEKGM